MRVVDWSSGSSTRWVDLVKVDVPKTVAAGYILASVIVYIIIIGHRPMAILADAMGDDGLFITLGGHLANGDWLGPFNQHTLMKGPGYPAFLAVTQWSGIPVSVAHAIFHCFCVVFFVVIANHFTRSYLLSGLLFTLLLWHPFSLSVYLTRVIRDEIYYGQVLLVLAAFSVVMFGTVMGKSRRFLIAVFGGAVLGWFWLTREEGIWIVPGIAIIVCAGGWRAFRAGRLLSVVAPLTILLCVFAFIQFGYRAGNFWAYGKFVGVDVKERNFVRAFGAINSVRSGGNKPFISATAAARERIYAVSPAFASLKPFIESPVVSEVSDLTCQSYPSACGEIASGWFIWVLRDAAAETGHFSSPAKASAFFGEIADEISAACNRAELECFQQLIPEMPQVGWGDLAERVPPRVIAAAHLLLMIDPPTQLNQSRGNEAELEQALHFLNRPLYSRVPGPFVPRYTLSGWYYKSGRDWMSVSVRKPDGSFSETHMSRTSSPDIQAAFKDAEASEQRFMLGTTCNDQCVLDIKTPQGQESNKTLGELRNGTELKMDGAMFYIDSVKLSSDPFAPTKIETFCNRMRSFLISHYFWLSIPALIAGLLSFFVATVFYWRAAMANVCYVMALASWFLVLLRAGLLIFIDATSFTALSSIYLAPAYFLLMSGALLSCAALLNQARPSIELREIADNRAENRISE